MQFKKVIVRVVIIQALAAINEAAKNLNLNYYGQTTADWLRSSGYYAENHHVISKDNYIVNVVRATNPLVNGGKNGLESKPVVLLIHGTLTTANCFLLQSSGVEPKDYSGYNAGDMSQSELERLLRDDKAKNSLAFTLLNFGHEIWLLNRRGSPESRGHVNKSMNVAQSIPNELDEKRIGSALSSVEMQFSLNRLMPSFNPLQVMVDAGLDLIEASSGAVNTYYWDFSLDEQAQYDLPAVVDYIIETTKRPKVSIVAHSAGGAITLMALADEPELAHKLDQIILWSPALDLGNTFIEKFKYSPVSPAFSPYIGPVPPDLAVPIVQGALSAYCSNPVTKAIVCAAAFDLTCGLGGIHRQIVPDHMWAFLTPVSSREIAQLGQSSKRGIMCKFDYGKERNRQIYGTSEPPAYNVSRIITDKISFWVGEYDALVSPADVEKIREFLRVRSEYHLIKNGFFNHVSFFIDDDLSSQLVLPNLIRLDS